MDSTNSTTNAGFHEALTRMWSQHTFHYLNSENLEILEGNLTASDIGILANQGYSDLKNLFIAKGNNSGEFIEALVSFQMYTFLTKSYPKLEEVIRQIPDNKFREICAKLPQQAQNFLNLQPQPIHFFYAALKIASEPANNRYETGPAGNQSFKTQMIASDFQTLKIEYAFLANLKKLCKLRPSTSNTGPAGIHKKSKVHKRPVTRHNSFDFSSSTPFSSSTSASRETHVVMTTPLNGSSASKETTAANLPCRDFKEIERLIVPKDEAIIELLGFRDFTHLYEISNNKLDCFFNLLIEFKCYALLVDSYQYFETKLTQDLRKKQIIKIVATLPENLSNKETWIQNPLAYAKEIFSAAAQYTYGFEYIAERTLQALAKKTELDRQEAFLTAQFSQLNLQRQDNN